MGKRFEEELAERKRELMADCEVGAEVFRGAIDRLEAFAEPFLATMAFEPDRRDGRTYLAGLLSDLPRKNAEAIAYRHDTDRQTIQEFISTAEWKRPPIADELVRQVAAEIGASDAVIVFDPSSFPKKGDRSVGVARQWCGRLGKVENCQVGIYMAYVTSSEHVLVDFRLFLPQAWTRSKPRLDRAHVPEQERCTRSRHELALEMLDARRATLPHSWVSGDDEMGRPAWFRRELKARGECYLLAVPSNTCIRDLESEAPVSTGRGRPRTRPFRKVAAWREALPESAWTRVTVRHAEKGPLEIEVAIRTVESKIEGTTAGFNEVLVVTRYVDGNERKHDYYLSNADRSTSPAEFARVAKAEHRVEDSLRRCKSEAGLASYQVRNWEAWHRHQLLSLLAQWFLVLESRRGKKDDARLDGSASASRPSVDSPSPELLRHRTPQPPRANSLAQAK